MVTKTKKKSVIKKAVTKKTRVPAKKSTTKKVVTKKKVVKKTTKKTPVKKAAKKTVTKGKRKSAIKPRATIVPIKYLVIATGSRVFWLNNGDTITNLLELHENLTNMEEDLFTHHTGEEYNHFAEWVEQVLEDADCAKKIRSTANRTKMAEQVKNHLKLYIINY